MDQDYLFRFGGVARVYGERELKRLADSHVVIVGVGGVGSWAAEAIVRTGIGKLTLIDFDDVCITNTNRQVHALETNIGKQKVNAMKERLLLINPQLCLNVIDDRLCEENVDTILPENTDFVIDAIDSLGNKCRLLAVAKQKGISVVVCGAAGGRRDLTKIQVDDLARAKQDALLKWMRKTMRKHYDFPKGLKKKFGVKSVFSIEDPYYPQENGCVTLTPENKPTGPLDCKVGFGTVTMVTATFGFLAAQTAVEHLISSKK